MDLLMDFSDDFGVYRGGEGNVVVLFEDACCVFFGYPSWIVVGGFSNEHFDVSDETFVGAFDNKCCLTCGELLTAFLLE
jgi:hypothetical protein